MPSALLLASAPPPAPFAHLQRLPLADEQITIGRALENTTVIAHPVISRSHCTFTRSEDNKWSIKDTSSFGIKINGKNIPKLLNIIVNDGDSIRLDTSGIFSYVFHKNPPKTANPPETPLNNKRKANGSNDESTNNLNWKKARLIVDGNTNAEPKASGSEKSNSNKNSTPDKSKDEKKLNEKLQNQLKEKEQENRQAIEKLKLLEEKLQQKEKSMKELQTENSEIKLMQKNKVTTPTSKKSKDKILKEIIEDDLQCSVCMEIFINPFILNCGHTLCKYCIDNCKRKNKLCPICRKTIKGEHPNITLHSLVDAVIEKLDVSPKSRRIDIIKKRDETSKAVSKRGKRSRTHNYNLRS